MALSGNLIFLATTAAALALLYDAEAYIVRGSLNVNGFTAGLKNHRDIYGRLYRNGVDLKEDVLFLVPRNELFTGGNNNQNQEINYCGRTVGIEREVRNDAVTKYPPMHSTASNQGPDEEKDKEEETSSVKYPEMKNWRLKHRKVTKGILDDEKHFNSVRSPNYLLYTRIPDNDVWV